MVCSRADHRSAEPPLLSMNVILMQTPRLARAGLPRAPTLGYGPTFFALAGLAVVGSRPSAGPQPRLTRNCPLASAPEAG